MNGDELYGLTEADRRDVAEIVAEHKKRMPGIGQVKRRLPPEASQLRIRLFRNFDGSNSPPDPDPTFIGPVGMTGVVVTAQCMFADAQINGGTLDSTDTAEVSGEFLAGVIPPGRYFWAKEGRDRWYAISDGITALQGNLDGTDELAYVIPIEDGDDFSTNTVNVAVEHACSEDMVDGTRVTAIFVNGEKFVVVSDCCPPEPD